MSDSSKELRGSTVCNAEAAKWAADVSSAGTGTDTDTSTAAADVYAASTTNVATTTGTAATTAKLANDVSGRYLGVPGGDLGDHGRNLWDLVAVLARLGMTA